MKHSRKPALKLKTCPGRRTLAGGATRHLAAPGAAGGLRIWTPPASRKPAVARRRSAPRARRQRKPEAAPITPGLHRRSDELARVEAALYLAREPLSARRLAKLARLSDGTRARTLLAELKRLHDESGSAFRVEQIANGFQLLTRGPFGPWVRRLLETPAETRLSSAGMETLAIVAYRQPITRAEVEAIRGVGCEEMLRQLLERDFIAIGGRAEELGRPNVYATTRRFLQAFGLARLEDLPPIAAAEPPPADAAAAG